MMEVIYNTSDSNLTNITAFAQNPVQADHPDVRLIYQLYFWIFGIVLCIVSLVGTVTNIINLYALSKSAKADRRSMYHFLICMAAVDLMIMVILLIRSIRFFIMSPMIIGPKLVYSEEEGVIVDYFTYVFYNVWDIITSILMTISNWSTVAMGLFRLVAVFAPLKAASLCTVQRARIVILFICILSVTINTPLIVEKRLEDGIFVSNVDVEKYNTISLVFTIPVPIFTCLVINSILIFRIKHYRTQVVKLFEGRSQNHATDSSTEAQQKQAEITLIAVSLFYVIMSVPNVVYYSASYSGLLDTLSLKSYHIFYIIANMAVYLSHACNFFFYVLLNKPFRTLLWRRIRKSKSDINFTRTSFIRGESTKLRRIATRDSALIPSPVHNIDEDLSTETDLLRPLNNNHLQSNYTC